jgi:hypothetical protein
MGASGLPQPAKPAAKPKPPLSLDTDDFAPLHQPAPPTSSAPSSSLVLSDRYRDVPRYSPGDAIDYHARSSCGPDLKSQGKTLREGYIENQAHCDVGELRKYTASNKAPQKVIDEVSAARRRSCTCSKQREAVGKRFKPPDEGHEFARKLAENNCMVCHKIEREFLQHGYIKDDSLEVDDRIDRLQGLIEMLSKPQFVPLWQRKPGTLDVEKMARFIWTDLLELDSQLANLKKTWSYEDMLFDMYSLQYMFDVNHLRAKADGGSRRAASALGKYASAIRALKLPSWAWSSQPRRAT